MTVQRASFRGEDLKSHKLFPIESPGIPIKFSFIHSFSQSWLYSVVVVVPFARPMFSFDARATIVEDARSGV
jgi:hypothetical protein